MQGRVLSIGEAARHCCRTVRQFKAAVRKGYLPPSLPFGEVWDIRALDRRLDELSGLTVTAQHDRSATKQAILGAIRGTA